MKENNIVFDTTSRKFIRYKIKNRIVLNMFNILLPAIHFIVIFLSKVFALFSIRTLNFGNLASSSWNVLEFVVNSDK